MSDRPSPRADATLLPPHSDLAEGALLGCLLLLAAAPARFSAVFAQVHEHLTDDTAFYDLRHRTIWTAMKNMQAEGQPVDMVTLTVRLTDTGRLEEAGGLLYLAGLPDTVPSGQMSQEYLDIVREKHLARQAVAYGAKWSGRVQSSGALTEAGVGEMQRELDALAAASARHLDKHPQNLCRPGEFGDELMTRWFNVKEQEPGWDLPFKFPLKIRPNELTLFTGDSGSGKSSMLGQIGIALAKQGVRSCVASFEVPPAITLWIMSRQLLGTKHLPDDAAGREQAAQALMFLNKHFWLYNFLGIGNWRELLDVFAYARAQHGVEVFVVDSVMRIGIEDDDYAMQGLVAARFADFAVQTGAHVFLVIHENKAGDGSVKNRVRGSKQWTDNAHNVVGMMRNEKKAEKRDDLQERLRTGQLTQEAHDKEAEGQRTVWDSKFLLNKQRWPGSQQNGSRYLWFDHPSLQFHDKPGQSAFNYLL